MADISKTVSIIFQADDKASGVAEKLAGSMKMVGDSAGLSAKQIEQAAAAEEKWSTSSIKAAQDAEKLAAAAKNTGDAAEKSSAQADRFVLTLKAIATAAVVKEFLDANSQLEKLTLGFTSVAGSTQGAAKEMEYVSGAADRMGIKIADAGGSYLKLAAATKGSALEGEGARTIFEAVAKELSLLGGSSADVSGALVQVAQGISKGKFELEDLKSIAERMPGFFDKFATSLGVTTPVLFDLISAGKIGGAEFLKFAESIKTSIDSIDVDTFEAKTARLDNAWTKFLKSLGDAGAFDAVKVALDAASYAATKAGASIDLVATSSKSVFDAVKSGDFSGLWDKISGAINKAGAAGLEFEAKIFGMSDALKEAGKSGQTSAAQIESEMSGTVQVVESARKATSTLDEQLKALGVDPKKVTEPIDQIIDKLKELGNNPEVNGEQFLAAFIKNVKAANSDEALQGFGGALTKAFLEQKISAEQLSTGVLALADQQKKVGDAMERTTGTSKAQAEELRKSKEAADKATEAAQKMALEYEKIASNERIKNIEFKVELDIARLEEDTKRVQAAFDSINNTINSTGDVISSSLSLLKDFDSLDWGALRIIESQLEKENQLRREAFELQKELTQAQIRSVNAQTAQIEKGDALIKIDGAGLQPHLEGFMWEILRTVQVRANRDGRAMLLGF